ncbi:MAG: PPC domain-containing DNA-binding protein [Candidatus Eisenbacteria bacterium]
MPPIRHRHRSAFAACAILLAAATATAAPARDTLTDATTFSSNARWYALRLRPGQDLRAELQRFAREKQLRAAFVASCAGSCTRTAVRYANQPAASVREGHFEIVSLTGTLAADGMHVHASFADSTGATFGGHLMDGSLVYTTAEIVIGELERAAFAREVDSTYGYRELVVRKRR